MADWLELDDVVVAERGDLAPELSRVVARRPARGVRPASRLDDGQAGRLPRPVPGERLGAGPPDDRAQRPGDHDDVVRVAQHGHDVRHEVDRREQVGEQQPQPDPDAAREACGPRPGAARGGRRPGAAAAPPRAPSSSGRARHSSASSSSQSTSRPPTTASAVPAGPRASLPRRRGGPAGRSPYARRRARDRAAPGPGHRPDAVHPAGRRAVGDRRRRRAGARRVRRAGLLPVVGQAEPGHGHQRRATCGTSSRSATSRCSSTAPSACTSPASPGRSPTS